MSTDLRWESITPDDLDPLGELIRSIEAVDRPRKRQSVAGLGQELSRTGADPARDTRLLRDPDGRLVGYAWNFPQHADVSLRRVLLTGGVHPDRRRQGIGHQLVRWQRDAGREWDAQTRQPGYGPLRHVARVDNDLTGAQRLLESCGLSASRWFAHLPRSSPPARRRRPHRWPGWTSLL